MGSVGVDGGNWGDGAELNGAEPECLVDGFEGEVDSFMESWDRFAGGHGDAAVDEDGEGRAGKGSADDGL